MEKRIIAASCTLAVITVFLVVGTLIIHPFGEPNETSMDDYMIQNTQQQTGTNNGVTAIVFDYRGFDTLGEATILFTAVAAVIMLFRRRKHE
ncbi:MAG: hydrogen gas-evolving membrane-bound hydrogenase subunit E [Candidatus Thermoplasmatota archaeon]